MEDEQHEVWVSESAAKLDRLVSGTQYTRQQGNTAEKFYANWDRQQTQSCSQSDDQVCMGVCDADRVGCFLSSNMSEVYGVWTEMCVMKVHTLFLSRVKVTLDTQRCCFNQVIMNGMVHKVLGLEFITFLRSRFWVWCSLLLVYLPHISKTNLKGFLLWNESFHWSFQKAICCPKSQ